MRLASPPDMVDKHAWWKIRPVFRLKPATFLAVGKKEEVLLRGSWTNLNQLLIFLSAFSLSLFRDTSGQGRFCTIFRSYSRGAQVRNKQLKWTNANYKLNANVQSSCSACFDTLRLAVDFVCVFLFRGSCSCMISPTAGPLMESTGGSERLMRWVQEMEGWLVRWMFAGLSWGRYHNCRGRWEH